jgi:hypothetical protein
MQNLDTYAGSSTEFLKIDFSVDAPLKGPCHEIFDLWFFSSNNSIWAPDTRFEAFLHMTSYLRRYSTMKLTFLVVSGVKATADHKKAICKKGPDGVV